MPIHIDTSYLAMLLWQPPRLRTYDVNTSVTDDTSTALSFIEEDDTNVPKPNPDIFEPAADLDTFRNVDPSKFEWVNPDEIEAGGTTCGFLKAPFGWPAGSVTGYKEYDTQTEYPFAKVCKYMFVLWCILMMIFNSIICMETAHTHTHIMCSFPFLICRCMCMVCQRAACSSWEYGCS